MREINPSNLLQSIYSGNMNRPLSLSSSRTAAAASATAVVLAVAVATTAFRMGYHRAKTNLLRQMFSATSGCILLQDVRDLNDNNNNNNNNSNDHSTATTTTVVIPAPRRFGACIKLKPDQYVTYRTLHDHVWDQVQQRLYDSHIRNFTIYYHAETSTLYQHFEWIGHWMAYHEAAASSKHLSGWLSVAEEQALLDADFQAIAHDPVTREWWNKCEPCQEPFSQWYQQQEPQKHQVLPSEGNTTGDWWAPLECVCHLGHYPIAYSTQTTDPDFVPLSSSS